MAKALLRGLSISRIALVDKGASYDPKTGDGAHVLLFKRATAPGEDNPMTDTKKTAEELQKRIVDLESENAALKKAAQPGQPKPEDVLKGASPEVVALLKAQEERAKKAEEQAAANAAEIAEIKKAARKTDLRKRADVFAALSGDKDVLAQVIGVVEDAPEGKALVTKFEETLKAWNAQLEKGGVVGDEIGSRGPLEGAPGSALEEVKKRVQELQKADAKVTESDAIAKVLAKDPALYERYVEETSGRGSADKK